MSSMACKLHCSVTYPVSICWQCRSRSMVHPCRPTFYTVIIVTHIYYDTSLLVNSKYERVLSLTCKRVTGILFPLVSHKWVMPSFKATAPALLELLVHSLRSKTGLATFTSDSSCWSALRGIVVDVVNLKQSERPDRGR